MSLNDLQALVHHRGRVDGDLGAHVPVRVRGGTLSQHFRVHGLHLFEARVAEGAAAAREDDFLHAALGHALQALENGRVLGVHRQHADAVLLEEGSNHGAASNEGLLVCQGNVLASLHGLDGRDEAGATDDAGDDSLAALIGRHGDLAIDATHDLGLVVRDLQGLDAGLQLLDLRVVARNQVGLPLLHLLEEELHVLARGKGHRLEHA
mmetsp:Transcript_61903/g.159687  ORF Transcript_61903/g.159687 Transcript_61903/m.159687 type:complete len:208 (+) Transcript_61903:654-1277(+)